MKKEDELCCSFCGKSHLEVNRLVTSPDGSAVICDECILACKDILGSVETKSKFEEIKLPTPKEINGILNEYIIGQEEVKKVLSVAVYNHYKRINYLNNNHNDSSVVDLDKSNVLMIGPTGCGKTLIAKTLAKILQVPFAQADATTLTEAGYVGEDVENILLKLIQNADYDIAKAERGIIYIDEIDKLTSHKGDRSISRDVGGEGVQQSLLKIIEGTVASVPPQGGRKHPHQEMLKIDTSNILFICGGAFVGLNKILQDKKDKQYLGFNSAKETASVDDVSICPEDLIKYGLIPEFIGRLPITVRLSELNEDDLVRVLQEPKNSLVKQYQTLLAMDNVELVVESEALIGIAHKSMELKTGARGLRSIMENIMQDIMYNIPSDKGIVKAIIDKNCIETKNPVIVRNAEETAV